MHERLGGIAALAAVAAGSGITPAAAQTSATEEVKAWTDMADALRPLSAEIAPDSATVNPAVAVADTNWMLLSAMSQYIINFRGADPNFPQFTPFLNTAFNSGAPVPDYIYQIAVIDGRGTYRLSGTRGTSRFVEFGVLDGLDGKRNVGGQVGHFSFDDITVAPDGTFSAILSSEKPSGYSGNWIRLDPTAASILVRHAAYDWKAEIDARLAIERIDTPLRTDSPLTRNVAAEMKAMLIWSQTRVRQWSKYIAEKRKAGKINMLEPVGFQGGVADQLYLEGLFDIDDDHVLIVETDVPDKCRYWSILATDNNFSTFDWLRHQSSLNGHQARIDSDGKFRAVIASRDPGVPNWIDTAGLWQGVIQHRWNGCSSKPMPTVRKVALSELRTSLPTDTPSVSPEQRAKALSERREGAQLRRRW